VDRLTEAEHEDDNHDVNQNLQISEVIVQQTRSMYRSEARMMGI